MKLVVKFDFPKNSFIGKNLLKGFVSDVRLFLVQLNLCLGIAETQARYGKYVEIWNYHDDGSRSLVSFWN